MELDQFALVEKVIKDVDNLLRKEQNISSFEIVPVDANRQNRSPVLHQGNSLGIESWCIKHLYMTCYSELMDSEKSKKKNRTIDCDKLIRLLNVTLLINPDVSTLWNKRRDMVLKGRLDVYSEMRYVGLVLSRKSKCNEAFIYRRWILESIISDLSAIQNDFTTQFLTEELNVCSRAAENSPNNYHAWSHRIWFIQRLTTSQLSKQLLQWVYCTEYAFSEQWCVCHVSDHSCFQYRQFCLKNILKLRDAQWREFEKYTSANLRRSLEMFITNYKPNDVEEMQDICNKTDEYFVKLILGESFKSCNCKPKHSLVCRILEVLFYELKLNDELVKFYKNHETLWYHRRYIVHEILNVIHDYHGINRKNVKAVKNSCGNCQMNTENKAKIVCYDSDCVLSCLLCLVYANCDRQLIAECREFGDNYADRHEKYLKFIEGVSL